jgi:hypothetical protein
MLYKYPSTGKKDLMMKVLLRTISKRIKKKNRDVLYSYVSMIPQLPQTGNIKKKKGKNIKRKKKIV